MKIASLVFTIAVLLSMRAIAVATSTAETPARSIEYIGTYEKVESATGEHCSGYRIDLWRHEGKLFGLLHHHRGLCGDPPCGVLTAIQHDSRNGAFSFEANTGESEFYFSGKHGLDSLTGTLAERLPKTDNVLKETIQLPKKQDRYLAAQIDSLEKWHRLYDSVARCRGVEMYMRNR
jgi:hypothetical protein